MTIIKPSAPDCKNLIENAGESLKLAKNLFEQKKWNLVVRNCIDSMELSLKGVLGLIIGKYPTTHDFQDEESKKLYDEAMKIITELNETNLGYFQGLFLTRLFFIPLLWKESYTNAKYGDKWHTKVYQKLEAEFIIKQTEEFVNSAETVYDDIVGW